ncbi:hypothetical protein [Eubacterium ramulus]
MTFKEYAHTKARELIKSPTKATVARVVNDITTATVDDRPITEDEIRIILKYLEDEIGNLHILCETFENKEVLSLMSEVKKLIAQANAGKK